MNIQKKNRSTHINIMTQNYLFQKFKNIYDCNECSA